jgi:hypothetical protein
LLPIASLLNKMGAFLSKQGALDDPAMY